MHQTNPTMRRCYGRAAFILSQCDPDFCFPMLFLPLALSKCEICQRAVTPEYISYIHLQVFPISPFPRFPAICSKPGSRPASPGARRTGYRPMLRKHAKAREIETPTRQIFSAKSYLYHVTRIMTICRSSPIETKPSSLASFLFLQVPKRHRGEDEPGSTRNKCPASRKRERTNNLHGPTSAFGEPSAAPPLRRS